MSKAKPFTITKEQCGGLSKEFAAGVKGPASTIRRRTPSLSKHLYRVWNRMSSGSYMPPPVRMVEIPKAGGGTRPLGIPTVSDRIAQTVVAQELKALLEPLFHEDSYGYRPFRSAHDAIAKARKRCWRRDWVVDVDIKSFFDTFDYDLLMKAVRHHVSEPWMLLYIQRWLAAPVQHPDGRLEERNASVPQGGVISPLLANL